MKEIVIVTSQGEEVGQPLSLAGTPFAARWVSCEGDARVAAVHVQNHDGVADVIALEGIPRTLELGQARAAHLIGDEIARSATTTPVVDGSGVRAGLERWGVILADRAEPGIFSQKRVLMCPGLNHVGLSQALGRHTPLIRYFDPEIYFGLPHFPGVGSSQTLGQVAGPTLDWLRRLPIDQIRPAPTARGARSAAARFRWADVIAGDVEAIRMYAPPSLRRKTVVVPYATDEDAEDLRTRGASILVTLLPSLDGGEDGMARHSAAVLEAALAAVYSSPDAALSEGLYLNHVAELDWKPGIRYLQQGEQGVNRFAFVIHPLNVDFIHKHPSFRWTRHLPRGLVEETAAWMRPMYVSRIKGGCSPTTGQRIEGHLLSLGATPRQMMRHGVRFTYSRLNQAARMAERLGCRLMGLGAFTSVVGDAGLTVAHETDIAVTSGNSLTVSATLEAAKQGAIRMGWTDLSTGRAMIIGATGSIGSVCARLLAEALHDVVLVSIEPEKLIDLKRTIEAETPGSRVAIATRPTELVGSCDLVVTATSAFGQRILDLSRCKPGAVICDVARPPDIGQREADLRPDVLVIESGEVLIPGEVDFGYDIGLPPGTAYACLAETALLAMEGRFEDYTLGRNIELGRVKEIYRLFKKHDFKIAQLRSFGQVLSAEDFARKRALAAELHADPDLFEQRQKEVAEQLALIPVASKGVPQGGGSPLRWAAVAGGLGLAAIWLRRRRRSRRSETS